jgi:hypothetical protein
MSDDMNSKINGIRDFGSSPIIEADLNDRSKEIDVWQGILMSLKPQERSHGIKGTVDRRCWLNSERGTKSVRHPAELMDGHHWEHSWRLYTFTTTARLA